MKSYSHYNSTYQSAPLSPYILTVTGVGEIVALPNQVDLRLGIVKENMDVLAAQDNVTMLMNQLVSVLTEYGINKKDIQTIQFTIHPQYAPQNEALTLRGYEVAHILQISLCDESKAGEIIDLALKHGVNRVDSISFTHSNRDNLYTEALQKAVLDAYDKAKKLCESLGVSLVITPLKVEEQPVPTIYSKIYSLTSESSSPALMATNILPGELKVTGQVIITWTYLPK